jgi:alpha-tubulin suppressor-like RCC1 family protein
LRASREIPAKLSSAERFGGGGIWADQGQLGIGTTQSSASPVAVLGGLTFANLTVGGFHSCGVTTTSVAYCWGSNEHFALGNDETFPGNPVPIRVEGQP